MLERISLKITDICARHMCLTEIEQLTMFYGFENLIHEVLLFGCMGAVAALLHIFWETVLFMLVFGGFRIIAGGFHLKTSIGCTLATTGLAVGGTEFALALHWSIPVVMIGFLLSMCIVLKCAPRRTEQHPVDDTEYGRLKKKSFMLVLVCGVTACLLTGFIRDIISVAVMAEALTLIPKPHE